MTENSKVKDNLFVDLFCNDQDGTKNFLSLYNALHNTNLKLEEVKIEPKRIEQVMYRTLANDVAMEIDNKLIVMVEQQSTVNKNMPLRFLMYVARLYESIIDERDKYKRSLVEIPTPEFYVIYNGNDNYPKESTLSLSKAFKDKDIPPQLDLTVTVYNVNKYRDLNIVQNCKAMNDYCRFIDLINNEKSSGENEDKYKHAIEKALKMGILDGYLDRKVSEVINMLTCEYDYATDVAVQREEAREEGREEGIYSAMMSSAQTMLNMNMPIEQIMQITRLPASAIYSLQH